MFAIHQRCVSGLLACLLIGACSFVPLDDNGKRVRVVDSAAETEGCEAKGEITASVRDKLAFYEREQAKVSDEVEALARNEPASEGADTIRATNELKEGSRTFAAFRCK
jgi:metal-sulfur cluster biosynthetic enzyme